MHIWITLALVTLLDILDVNGNSPIHNFPKWYLLQQLDGQDNINSNEVGEKDLTQVEPIESEEMYSHTFDAYGNSEEGILNVNDFDKIFDIAEQVDDNFGGLNRNKRLFASADNADNAEQEITKEIVPEYIYRGGHENNENSLPHLNEYSLNPDGVDRLTHSKDVSDELQTTEYKPDVIFKIWLFYVAQNLNDKMKEKENSESYKFSTFLSKEKENKNQMVTMVERSLFDKPVGRNILSQLVDKGDILQLVKGEASERNSRRPPIIQDFNNYLDFFESYGENTPKPHNRNLKTFEKHQESIISKDKEPVVKKRIFSIFSKWKQFSPVNGDVKFRRPSYIYRNNIGAPSEEGDYVTAETRGYMRAPGSPLRWG